MNAPRPKDDATLCRATVLASSTGERPKYEPWPAQLTHEVLFGGSA